MMARRLATVGLAVATCGWLTGCATGGGTPRPFPVPGAAGGTSPDPARSGGMAAAAALVRTALTLVGSPYRPGGHSPSTGFDCSGYVTWVFGQHGVAVPRTVGEQVTFGRALAPGSGPVAADLVFFQTEGRGASHVGIALGDGRFVHAPSSRGVVRVELLDAPYWARRFVGARRLLPDPPDGRR